MTDYVFAPQTIPSLAIANYQLRFPVHRIYCIGRNYAEHAREMGMAVDRANPVFFCKPADAVVPDGGNIAYPPATSDLHHEVEMVLALHRGGRNLEPSVALDTVFGYGVGLDLTRRDLQAASKSKGLPWDTAKAFDQSAPVSALRRVDEIGHPGSARLSLEVNGEIRQDTSIADMLFNPAEIIAHLSGLFELRPGDLIFTGTPSGVGPLRRGDRFVARLRGVAELSGRIV